MEKIKQGHLRDVVTSTVVFFVAMSLCLTVATIAGVPLALGFISSLIGAMGFALLVTMLSKPPANGETVLSQAEGALTGVDSVDQGIVHTAGITYSGTRHGL
jgi:hypothetical protein